MSELKKSVQIKSFSTVIDCHSEEDLRHQIELNFLQQSISIVTTNTSGVTTPNFIDVAANGELTNSYSNKAYHYSDFF
ncbi:hypothetical protein [Shewanella sp. MBTL60-007]|uniref:hypothetical protein n=1 Tax=Shewanella sp. MBTL60-007 TaxID=2815911 RepID=UPI001BC1C407|nr:hypothetical protein [Shewanella sp. MBTL60-007]GIU20957.1 hypothetical protein TUM3792_21240 [Shewanella sp. MBTL60-007]